MNTGCSSSNRPPVTSTVRSGRSTRASWIDRSERPATGCDQVSHCESGENDGLETGPNRDAATSVTPPSAMSTSSSRPSEQATASRAPSGEADSSCTRPIRPAAIRRCGARSSVVASLPGSGASSIASSPSASVTQAACPPQPSTSGSRQRTPGVSASTRAGPSRWVSQYSEPRTLITPARPVASQARSLTLFAALTWYGRRPARAPPSGTSSRCGAGASSESSSHRSPACW